MSASPSSSGPGIKESSLVWPMLDRANYAEWVMIMQCNLKALEMWHVIKQGIDPKCAQGHQAMAALLRSVP